MLYVYNIKAYCTVHYDIIMLIKGDVIMRALGGADRKCIRVLYNCYAMHVITVHFNWMPFCSAVHYLSEHAARVNLVQSCKQT